MNDKEHGISDHLRRDSFLAVPARDRRHQKREETGLRPVRIIVGAVEESFFIRNISPGGAMGQTGVMLAVGELVRIKFESGTVALATVRWTRGARVGLQFLRPLSVQETLAERPPSNWMRDTRYRTSRSAVLACGEMHRTVKRGAVSRGGAQVEAPFDPGRLARVSVAGGPSLTCQMRWTRDGASGLMCTRPVDLDEFR